MMKTNAKYDVIIIGAGIVGASAALFLSRRGIRVAVFESGMVGQYASGTNFGGVRTQARPMHQLPLAMRSTELWRQMPQLIGHDIEYVESGMIRVAYNQDDAEQLKSYVTQAAEHGFKMNILAAKELRANFPYLSDEFCLAIESKTDGHANPRLAAPAIALAAELLGAEIYQHSEVVKVERAHDEFIIKTYNGTNARSENLLICAGPWGAALSERFGEPVPTVNLGPQMGVTEPVPHDIRPVISVFSSDPKQGVYFRQIDRGNIIFGGTARTEADIVAKRAHVKPENTLWQIKQLGRVVPALKQLRVIRVWSGIEGYTPDSDPVFGPSEKVPGLFYAFGLSGQGFQLGPVLGETLSELVIEGRATLPIDSFRISRFSRPKADSAQLEGTYLP